MSWPSLYTEMWPHSTHHRNTTSGWAWCWSSKLVSPIYLGWPGNGLKGEEWVNIWGKLLDFISRADLWNQLCLVLVGRLLNDLHHCSTSGIIDSDSIAPTGSSQETYVKDCNLDECLRWKMWPISWPAIRDGLTGLHLSYLWHRCLDTAFSLGKC